MNDMYQQQQIMHDSYNYQQQLKEANQLIQKLANQLSLMNIEMEKANYLFIRLKKKLYS